MLRFARNDNALFPDGRQLVFFLSRVRHERKGEEECIQKFACQAPSGKLDDLLGARDKINLVRFAGPAEALKLLISGTSLDVWLASPMK